MECTLSSKPAERRKPRRCTYTTSTSNLKDNSDAATQKLVAACKKYLSGHPGTVFFATGVLAKDCNRPVNIGDFDVALHVVFKDKAADDAYQKAERHLKFIAENQDNCAKSGCSTRRGKSEWFGLLGSPGLAGRCFSITTSPPV